MGLSKIHYEYDEIPSKNHINKNHADGIGFMTNSDKFQLVYMKGSRSVAKQEKEMVDAKKIVNNLKRKYRLNEIDNANLPRELLEMPDFVYFYECTVYLNGRCWLRKLQIL